METEDRSLHAQLEWEEQILWDWEPDTKMVTIEEYVKLGILVIVIAAIWVVVVIPNIWMFMKTGQIVGVAFLSFFIIVPICSIYGQARDLGLFQRKFSMEKYIITDRRLLVRNRKNPQWLSITYDKMEYLKVHATGLSIDGRVRNIDIIWLSDKDDGKKSVVNETRMSHVDGWETAVRIMYSRKFNVSMEEVDLTNKFVHVEPR